MDATVSPSVEPKGLLLWLEEFLSSELSPYPGRGVTVARMVISATVTMLLIMTFRIPGGALGALYAFLISRDNLRSTFRSGLAIAISYILGVWFVLLGAAIFADQESARIVWFAGSMFVTFFVLRTLRYSDVATGFAVLLVNALPIWQTPATAEHRVELTLWQTLAVAIGTLVTILVEVIFHSFNSKSELQKGITQRLRAALQFIEAYATGESIASALETEISKYSIVGTSGLRRILARSRHRGIERDELSTMVALVGRLVDLTVASGRIQMTPQHADKKRLLQLASNLKTIIQLIEDGDMEGHQPAIADSSVEDPSSMGTNLLEIERTVSMISRVLAHGEPSRVTIAAWKNTYVSLNSRSDARTIMDSPSEIVIADAFENRAHLMWALRGCLAATLCYLTYEMLDWRGISTSVTTCVITALSTAGASRQKQVLRITGAIVGGLILGMGSQIFIFPYIDSIGAFTILFVVVTSIGAWFATSSSRLSYFGVQIALAFYLIGLQEFSIQTSLTVARDRVVGILLGLFMMWLIFDRFGDSTATTETARAFCTNLRTIAAMFEQAGADDLQLATERTRALREEISANFEKVNAQADAIPFEFGLERKRGMEIRSLVRRWQPNLRSVYLLEVACLQHRLFEADDPIPWKFWERVGSLSRTYTSTLKALAGHLEAGEGLELESNKGIDSLRTLSQTLESEAFSPGARIRANGIVELLQQIHEQIQLLSQEILSASDWQDLWSDGDSESFQRARRQVSSSKDTATGAHRA